ncbi:MAG TPA: hypothetical protein VN181_09235 [Thermoanaerobaculia bacterium]|nr:hypothetical protein [Thermoanaerobaculia bacterium]
MSNIETLLLIADRPLPVSLRERVLTELTDAFFAIDALLEIARADECERMHWLIPNAEHVYEELDALMRRLTD